MSLYRKIRGLSRDAELFSPANSELMLRLHITG
jgi:hypothetical protein